MSIADRLKKSFIVLCLFLLGSCGSGPAPLEYRIGMDPSWYPVDLMGRENNVTAFSTELLQEISLLKKLRFAKVNITWDNLSMGLQKSQYMAMLSSLQPQIFLQSQYDFSSLYLNTGPVLVVPSQSNISSMDMLSGKEIAVQNGSSGALILEKQPGIIIRHYDSIPKALNDILKGDVDGAIVDVLTAEGYCQDLYQGQLKIATPPLNDEGLRMVTLHGKATDLIDAFNSGLKELKANGKYDQLSRKWGLSQ